MILEFLLSIFTIAMLWLMGSKSKWGPIVGLFGQIFWIWFVISNQIWGLAPGVLAVTIVTARNSIIWWKVL
jgi:hypothetical protein